MKALGRAIVAGWLVIAVLAPWLAPYSASQQFSDLAYAPPTLIRVTDAGSLAAPFVRRLQVVDPLTRRFAVVPDSHATLRWITAGHLFGSADPATPVFLLGTDGLGRDLFSRLVLGARVSLTIAVAAILVGLALGTGLGVLAGFFGGLIDRIVMRLAEFTIILPLLYVVLALRAALPLHLTVPETLAMMVIVFAAVSWPMTARGVRAIVAAERRRDYVVAATALGAGPVRVMLRHLVPATFGFVRTQAVLLVPMVVIAEATLSYAGLGLPDEAPGWGTLLQEAANIGAIGGAPWLLAPALALFSLVLGTNLAVERGSGDLVSPGAVMAPARRSGASLAEPV